jgi:hypothetical protein
MTLEPLRADLDLALAREIDFSSYLARSGWTPVQRSDLSAVWTRRHQAQVLRLVLPSPGVADFHELMYEALRVIAFAADKSLVEVLADVEFGGADVVSVRLASSAPSGQAPLTMAQAAVTALRAFVIGSAAGLDAITAVLPARRPRAERFANQVRLSTTAGSFVMTVALPLFERPAVGGPESLQTTLDDSVVIPAVPYGREVARRMRDVAQQAIRLTREIAEGEEDITAFESDPAASGNATELEGLSGLGGRGERRYEVRFTQSPVIAPDPDVPTVLAVEPDAQELFRKAARLLRERKPKDDVTIRGQVVRLARDGGLGPGDVVIRGREPGAQNEHRYRVHLSEDQYGQAIAAHERSAEVSARGSLAIRGNFLMLEPLAGFTVQLSLPDPT